MMSLVKPPFRRSIVGDGWRELRMSPADVAIDAEVCSYSHVK